MFPDVGSNWKSIATTIRVAAVDQTHMYTHVCVVCVCFFFLRPVRFVAQFFFFCAGVYVLATLPSNAGNRMIGWIANNDHSRLRFGVLFPQELVLPFGIWLAAGYGHGRQQNTHFTSMADLSLFRQWLSDSGWSRERKTV